MKLIKNILQVHVVENCNDGIMLWFKMHKFSEIY